MTQVLIEKLTPEQESLIPVIFEKWKAIAIKTGPIVHQKAEAALKLAYAAIGKNKPKVLFFDSPYAALSNLLFDLESKRGQELRSQLSGELASSLSQQVQNQLKSTLGSQLTNLLENKLWMQLEEQLWNPLSIYLWSQLRSQVQNPLESQPRSKFDNCIPPEFWACHGSWLDFCISVLKCTHDRAKWEAFQMLVTECGWIYPYEKVVIASDRPIKLSFDSANRLHAEGEPAILFADGYGMYAYNGVSLPEKYGTVHPHQWRSQWLLEEPNAELRRVLIQGIGYGRICQELQAIKLDNWKEYTLLKLDVQMDGEPIYLIKMICPSTGFIHAHRVPPYIQSAREGISWVNWGIDPEDFSAQT